MLSVNLNAIDWTHLPGPAQLKVHASPASTGLPYNVEGSLHISKNGYVYSLSSAPVLWLKFLGLATALSLSGIGLKCSLIGRHILQRPVSQEKNKGLQHIWHLAGIAGRAVIGVEDYSLIERVEQFALSEIDHNNANRQNELDLPRSLRLTSGAYIAKCMQPLFHVEQAQLPIKLSTAIAHLETERSSLQQELRSRQTTTTKVRRLLHAFNPLNVHTNLSNDQIEEQLRGIETKLTKKKKQQDVAERCNKYATLAILKQQSALTQALKDAVVDTQAEVECCNILCYRQQKICGLLHRIECCATKCWAIDLACCFCCFWPEGRSYCCIC